MGNRRYDDDGYLIRDTAHKLAAVRKSISAGTSVVDAINRNCNTAESYAAALKEYGLKPTSNDYD